VARRLLVGDAVRWIGPRAPGSELARIQRPFEDDRHRRGSQQDAAREAVPGRAVDERRHDRDAEAIEQ
jgi:hypothetical protein